MFSATKGGSTAGYQISRSVRLRSSANAYFNRTPASAGNQQKWTWSGWVKRGALGANQVLMSAGTNGSSTNLAFLQFNSSDSFQFYVDTGAANYSLVTTQVFRDPSAWYHLVIAFDSTQATASNRTLIYVNGSQITAFSTANYTPQNNTYGINSTLAHNIGRYVFDNTRHFDGYLTEINFIDGQALTPSSFGDTNYITGVWQPKKYTGTYGTNGFYLNFSDNSAATAAAIGKDYSGNGNNWTPNNISVTAGVTYDSMLDVPTQWADGGNGRGNYATLNPLITGNVITTQDANLTAYLAGGSNAYFTSVSSFAITTGKWYWEFTQTGRDASAGQWFQCGIVSSTATYTNNAIGFSGNLSSAYAYYNDGAKAGNGTATAGYGATFTTFDVIGIAFDADNGTITFYKNGVSQGQAFSGISSALAWYPVIQMYRSATTFQSAVINFGQRPFAYTPPSGFKALNTLNLPTPTILKGNQYFNTVLYTGNGGTLSVTGVGFQPDFVWLKSRGAARSHRLWDAVRGATNGLSSDLTNAEYVESGLTAFNSDGFTLGSQSGSNTNAEAFVAWNWKEGATQGFDIVTYTGDGVARTIAHNLGVAPKMIIVKNRNTSSYNWFVWHTAFGAAGNTDYINLNLTDAKGSGGAVSMWNNTMPTSSVFSLGTYAGVNGNTNTYVAYLFAEVAGFSRFDSYTGNGSADGPFVFCGFRPRFVMIKRTDSTSAWLMVDTVRQTYNVLGPYLTANTSDAETTGTVVLDVLSNGFKMRSATTLNASGGTYIFAAFAENPFKNALAR